LAQDSHLNQLEALPRGRPKVGRALSARGRTWVRAHHMVGVLTPVAHLRARPKWLFEPTIDRCDPVKLLVDSLLHGRDIGRSELTRQHEVKSTQRDDGRAKLANDRDHVVIV
jgi:hypothetical protein